MCCNKGVILSGEIIVYYTTEWKDVECVCDCVWVVSLSHVSRHSHITIFIVQADLRTVRMLLFPIDLRNALTHQCIGFRYSLKQLFVLVCNERTETFKQLPLYNPESTLRSLERLNFEI